MVLCAITATLKKENAVRTLCTERGSTHAAEITITALCTGRFCPMELPHKSSEAAKEIATDPLSDGQSANTRKRLTANCVVTATSATVSLRIPVAIRLT